MARQILLDAAAYIEEHGWCQHETEDDDGRVCAVGAISKAGLGLAFTVGIGRTFRAFADTIGTTTGGIARWNDTPGRTQTEVVAAFKRAAEGQER